VNDLFLGMILLTFIACAFIGWKLDGIKKELSKMNVREESLLELQRIKEEEHGPYAIDGSSEEHVSRVLAHARQKRSG
jgi:hypothetical protein